MTSFLDEPKRAMKNVIISARQEGPEVLCDVSLDVSSDNFCKRTSLNNADMGKRYRRVCRRDSEAVERN